MKKLIITIGIVLGVALLSSCGGSPVANDETPSSSSVEVGVSSSIDPVTPSSAGTSSSSVIVLSSSSVFVDTWTTESYDSTQADFRDKCRGGYGWGDVGQYGDLWEEIIASHADQLLYSNLRNYWYTGVYFPGDDTTAESSYLKEHATGKAFTLTCAAFKHRSVVENLKAEGYTITTENVYFEAY